MRCLQVVEVLCSFSCRMIPELSPPAYWFDLIDHKRKWMCWTTRLVVVYRSKLPLTYPARCSGCSESRSIFFSQCSVLCAWVCSPHLFFSRTLMPPWVFLRCILRNRESADHTLGCFLSMRLSHSYPRGYVFTAPSPALFLCLRVQFFLLFLFLLFLFLLFLFLLLLFLKANSHRRRYSRPSCLACVSSLNSPPA